MDGGGLGERRLEQAPVVGDETGNDEGTAPRACVAKAALLLLGAFGEAVCDVAGGAGGPLAARAILDTIDTRLSKPATPGWGGNDDDERAVLLAVF